MEGLDGQANPQIDGAEEQKIAGEPLELAGIGVLQETPTGWGVPHDQLKAGAMVRGTQDSMQAFGTLDQLLQNGRYVWLDPSNCSSPALHNAAQVLWAVLWNATTIADSWTLVLCFSAKPLTSVADRRPLGWFARVTYFVGCNGKAGTKLANLMDD
ncbi:hypothetical protein B0T14DRAFT_560462 [Immersiella caudata]|uniref:Uncharacterized protein n=1 Tax=Immersiella caudata TaxID=314043 RepID=A0AA40CBN2_9PEZI|nr:hypothetical protein B0T14DRAFT_560462 [Immersiella caudata]